MVDPEVYRGSIRVAFDGDPDFSGDHCHPIALSAFGDLILWSESHWNMSADFRNGELVPPLMLEPHRKTTQEIHIYTSLVSSDYTEDYDLYDDAERPLFKRAKRELGSLEPDEIYALKLAPALGGIAGLENLKRVKAREQIGILAQLMHFSHLASSGQSAHGAKADRSWS